MLFTKLEIFFSFFFQSQEAFL